MYTLVILVHPKIHKQQLITDGVVPFYFHNLRAEQVTIKQNRVVCTYIDTANGHLKKHKKLPVSENS